MESYQRVASRYLKAFKKGNLTIELVRDGKYADGRANIGVELQRDGEYMGHVHAKLARYSLAELESDFECWEDIESMSEEYWFEELYEYDEYNDDLTVCVVEVLNSHLEEGLRGQKCGIQMYLELAKQAYRENGKSSFLFLPNYCHKNATSPEARRVWSSLAKKFYAEGDVIVIDRL